MTHVRTQIRDAVAVLVTGLPVTGANVVAGRATPVTVRNSPGIRVYTDTDTIDIDAGNMAETVEYHELSVVLEVHARALPDADAQLDAIHVDLQAVLLADITLQGLAEFLRFDSLEVEQVESLDEPISIGTLTYRVHYRVNGADLETPIP